MGKVITKFRVVAFSVIFAVASYAQATPEEIVENYYSQLRTNDYQAAAQLFVPSELKEFRRRLSFLYKSEEESYHQIMVSLFGPGATIESVSRLSDAEFFSSFLALVMTHLQGNGNVVLGDIEVLGKVVEGPDLAHVVVRFSVELKAGGVAPMDVATVRVIDGSWMMVMNADFQAFANQFRATYETAH